MRDICQEQYQVIYHPTTATVVCAGHFRLRDQEYGPILALLNAAAEASAGLVTLDLREVRFCNSSGINTLAQFVLRLRQQASPRLVIHGSTQYVWQHRCLKNLARLLPGVQLDFA